MKALHLALIVGLAPLSAAGQDAVPSTRHQVDEATSQTEAATDPSAAEKVASPAMREVESLRREIDALQATAGSDDRRKLQSLRDRVDRLAADAGNWSGDHTASADDDSRKRFDREIARIRSELASLREAGE